MAAACSEPGAEKKRLIISKHIGKCMRKLDARSLEILRKLAPDLSEPVNYRSILPPVSMHHATDVEDFQERLERLSAEDFNYLSEKVLDKSECLLCISPESARIFIDLLEIKVPGEAAERIRELYKSSTGYDV
jgi:hypothetical protein